MQLPLNSLFARANLKMSQSYFQPILRDIILGVDVLLSDNQVCNER